MVKRKINEEVVVDTAPIVKIDRIYLQKLAISAKDNLRNRIRLCAHDDINAILHEMFIVHEYGTYVRPHKHLNNCESFHVIEGEVDVIIYYDDGNIREIVSMGDYYSSKPFYYRLKIPSFHTLFVRSRRVIFHESTVGPFVRSNTVFADWSPEEHNVIEVSAFLNNIKKCLAL